MKQNVSFNYMKHLIPIIIDNGSGVIKAGFADNYNPSVVFPTAIGRLRRPRQQSEGSVHWK